MDEAILNAVSELRYLDPPERADALLRYPSQQALAIFEQLEAPLQQELLEWLPSTKVDQLLMELEPDDRVRLLDTLPEPVAHSLLSHLSPREWRLTQRLLSYPEESAGHIMTPEYLPLPTSLTAGEALELVRHQGRNAGTVNSLPVVDASGQFEGLVTLTALVLADPAQRVFDLMLDNVPSVAPETDQEDVARLIQAADLLAVPVVDDSGRLLGLVTIDDAMDVIHIEQDEDLARSGASTPLGRPYFSIGVRALTRARLVWLLLLALGGSLTVQVLNVFEGLLEEAITLALFVPLLIGVGGNSGAQSATTVTRAIATDDIPGGFAGAVNIVSREAIVGLCLGSALALIAFPVVAVAFGMPMAATVSITLIAICALATLVGSGMPILATRLGIDPAVVSAPVVTTIVDASGLVVYFVVAQAVMTA